MDPEHLKCIKKKSEIQMFNTRILLWNKKIECKYHIQINFGEKKKKKELESRYKKNFKKIEQMNSGKNISKNLTFL